MNKIKNFIKYFFTQLFSIREWDSHWVILILGIQLKIKINRKIPENNKLRYGVTKHKRLTPIVVSLTSFPARIHAVTKTIESLLSQTCSPDHLILWLAKEEFPNQIPKELENLKKYGLDIRWCDNIRSYKKLLPTLNIFPKAIIVTFDDDIYYPTDTLLRLYEAHLYYPNEVIAGRIGRIKKVGENFRWLSDRVRWGRKYDNPSYFNVLIGYGGCLYPPNSLSLKFIQCINGYELLPTHDDIYFWGATVHNHVKTRVIEIGKLIYLPETQQYGLCKINRKGKGTGINEALDILFKACPEIKNFLFDKII